MIRWIDLKNQESMPWGKKIVLLISLVVLLSSCWNKKEEILIEPTADTWVIEEEITPEENIVVSWSIDEDFDWKDETVTEKVQEKSVKEETPTKPKVVEMNKDETTTPVAKKTVKKEETTPTKVVDHEPTTPVADETTDELIDDMIGDIDNIFKEIESEG